MRPFVTGGKILCEVTFSIVSGRPNKFDRIIEFIDLDMMDKYSSQLPVPPASTNEPQDLLVS